MKQTITNSGYKNSIPGERQEGSFHRADYKDLAARIDVLTQTESDQIALMATLACELFHADDRFDWVGFYRAIGNETLKIGPYQGGHGCLRIPYSRGVCGAAARTGQVQIVADVEEFDGHIACAATTRAELVIPFFDATHALIGVLDIDSNLASAFDPSDAKALVDILKSTFRR